MRQSRTPLRARHETRSTARIAAWGRAMQARSFRLSQTGEHGASSSNSVRSGRNFESNPPPPLRKTVSPAFPRKTLQHGAQGERRQWPGPCGCAVLCVCVCVRVLCYVLRCFATGRRRRSKKGRESVWCSMVAGWRASHHHDERRPLYFGNTAATSASPDKRPAREVPCR